MVAHERNEAPPVEAILWDIGWDNPVGNSGTICSGKVESKSTEIVAFSIPSVSDECAYPMDPDEWTRQWVPKWSEICTLKFKEEGK